MKIVHIEDFIHPDAGYQVNLLSRLQVRQGHEVIVVTSELDKVPDYLTKFFGKDNIEERDNKFYLSTGVKIIRVPLITFYSGRSVYYPKLFRIVDSLRPDVAFVHGEDTLMGMQFIMRSSKLDYPIVLDCHMLEMASLNRFRKLFRMFYRTFITPKILKNNIPLIRVVDSDYVEKCLGIPLDRTILLSFGTDTDYFKPSLEARNNFRALHGIDNDAFVIVYAGKLDVYKGGLFFAESIKDEIYSLSGKKAIFVIIGSAYGDYGKAVDDVFLKSKNKIIRFSTQTYFDLAKFYQAADLALYPKQCSLSFFEAQSCGLPVLFEKNEINSQRAKYGNGILFTPGDAKDFRQKILAFTDMSEDVFSAMKINARKYILDNCNYVPIAQKFTDVLEQEVKRFSHGKHT